MAKVFANLYLSIIKKNYFQTLHQNLESEVEVHKSIHAKRHVLNNNSNGAVSDKLIFASRCLIY